MSCLCCYLLLLMLTKQTQVKAFETALKTREIESQTKQEKNIAKRGLEPEFQLQNDFSDGTHISSSVLQFKPSSGESSNQHIATDPWHFYGLSRGYEPWLHFSYPVHSYGGHEYAHHDGHPGGYKFKHHGIDIPSGVGDYGYGYHGYRHDYGTGTGINTVTEPSSPPLSTGLHTNVVDGLHISVPTNVVTSLPDNDFELVTQHYTKSFGK